MSADYEDILTLPHHQSQHHTRMPRADRAAQFAPFAALTGFEAMIAEGSRRTEDRVILSDQSRDLLDQKYQCLREMQLLHPQLTVSCFAPDGKKSGGIYHQISGALRQLDPHRKLLIFCDGRVIPLAHIDDIQINSPFCAEDVFGDF